MTEHTTERTREQILEDLATKMRRRAPVATSGHNQTQATPADNDDKENATPGRNLPPESQEEVEQYLDQNNDDNINLTGNNINSAPEDYIPYERQQAGNPTKQTEPQTKTCAFCGEEFTTTNPRKIYCNKKCNYMAQNQKKRNRPPDPNNPKPKDRIVRVKCGNPNCPRPGGIFETTEELYRKMKKYCSPECAKAVHREKHRPKPKKKQEKPVKFTDYKKEYKEEIVKQEPQTEEQISQETQSQEKPQSQSQPDSQSQPQQKEAPREAKATQEALIPYAPHSGGQQEIHDDYMVRFRVINAGTRWGKDRCSINEFIRLFVHMLSENRDDSLVPRVHGWIVAPTFPLARQSWRELKYFFPEQWVVSKNEAEHQLHTVMDGLIEVKSADNPDSLVSVGLDIVLMTEAARVKDLEITWGYIRGRLSSPGRGLGGQGGSALINSTPKGRGFYYTMYCWGLDPNIPEWKSYHHPTSDNPYIDPKEIEEAKRTLPDRVFRQEFLAEFLSDSGDVFANIDDVSTGVIQEPVPGETYKAAWDPAQKHDWSAFGIRNEKGEQVLLERWTGMPWTQQLDRVEMYCKKYNNAALEIDCTGIGETLVEAAQQRGLDAVGNFFSNTAKEQWVSHLAMLFEGRYPVLLSPGINEHTKAQAEELKSYTYTYTKTGKISYHHLPGQHDDCVSMLLLLYKDFNAAQFTMPYMGLLMGANRWKTL